MAPKRKARPGKKADEIDIIAALDAQAEQIGDLLESRVEQIDEHWRHSGGTKPGAVPKSGAKEHAVELGAKAKAATPFGAAALGSDAKVTAPTPPFKAPPAKAPSATAEAGAEEDDDYYDPFSEVPVQSGEDLVKDLVSTVQAMQAESNRTIRSLQAMQQKLAAADAKAKATPPWRKKQPNYVVPASGVSLASMRTRIWGQRAPNEPLYAAIPQTKAKPAVPIAGPKASAPKRTRIDAASERAKKYFKASSDEKSAAQKDAGAGGKRKAAEAVATFAQEVLDKAPATLQTCRSLLLFLDKKLETPLVSAPGCTGPDDMRVRLDAYADDTGRIEGLRAGGWDARAKRILDIGAVATSPAGEALLKAADQALETTKPNIEKDLRERGEKVLEDLIAERKKWAQESVRRDFLSWCAKVLRAREAALLKDSEEAASNTTGGHGPLAIFEAILKGSSGVSPSKG